MKKKAHKNKKTIFVGLSGGVDSAVSAALLKATGHNVVGVFLKTWQPDFIECTWKEERRDAMRVAAHLDIPFITLDMERDYKEGVADYMIREYKAGRTPNPDVMCNKEVKFGGFLQSALSMGADAIATGHYAQNKFINGRFELHKGVDPSKDQSYFLWMLSEKELMHVVFPVGNLKKSQVRTLARDFGIPVSSKKDSQGVCFLGPLDMKDFLSHYIPKKAGTVLDTGGNIIGSHDGALFLTLGERHGFSVNKKSSSEKPYYVIAKDIRKNTITVGHDRTLPSLDSNTLTLENFHAITAGTIDDTKTYSAQVRYHGEEHSCEVLVLERGSAQLRFHKGTPLVSPGQSVVLYKGTQCVGGGVVA